MKTLRLDWRSRLLSLALGRPTTLADRTVAGTRRPPIGRGGLCTAWLRAACCLGFLLPTSVMATPVFLGLNDSLAVDTPTGGLYQVQGGSLAILPGAEIAEAGTSFEPLSSIRMSGGRVLHGINNNRGSLEVTGGEVRGYDDALYGGDAARIFQGSARITGGTFVGGDSPGQAGSAVVASAGNANGVDVLSSLFIGGGEFRGGTGSGGYYGGDTGYSLLSIGNTIVAGGLFLSPIAINAAYGGVTEFVGSDLKYDAFTRLLSGTLQNGDSIGARIFATGANVVADPSGSRIRFEGFPVEEPPPTPLPDPIPEPSTIVVFGVMAAFALARGKAARSRISARPVDPGPSRG